MKLGIEYYLRHKDRSLGHDLVQVSVADGKVNPGGYCTQCGNDYVSHWPSFECTGEKSVLWDMRKK